MKKQVKKTAKRQGVSLAVTNKKKKAAPKKRSKKELSPEEAYAKTFKKENPIGGVYFEHFIGPVRLVKITPLSEVAVNATFKLVAADPTDGSVTEQEKTFTKSRKLQTFDVKKFLKETNALYKKVYLS